MNGNRETQQPILGQNISYITQCDTWRPAGALWGERVKSPDLFDIYARRARNRKDEVSSPIDQYGLEDLNYTVELIVGRDSHLDKILGHIDIIYEPCPPFGDKYPIVEGTPPVGEAS